MFKIVWKNNLDFLWKDDKNPFYVPSCQKCGFSTQRNVEAERAQ